MSHPIEQLITSLTKKPVRGSGFDPDYLADERIDPSVRADAGLGAMQGELRNRLFQAERSQGPSPNATPASEVTALRSLLGGYGQERAQSPLTQQQKQYDVDQANMLDSINQGFTGDRAIEQQPDGSFTASQPMSPMQQREIYKRNQVETNSPMNMAKFREDQENFRQGRQLNALNRQISAQMAPAQQRADLTSRMWDDLVNKRVTSDQVRSFNPSTGAIGFQSMPGINPNQLNSSLQRELGFAQAAGVTDPFETFGQPNSPTLATDNAIRSVIMNSGLQARSAQIVFDVLSDPQARQMTFEQLQQEFADFDELGSDAPRVRELLLRLRGK